MVIGVARAVVASSKLFKFVISTNQVNSNLRTLANAAGYSGYGHVEVTINSNIDCYASNTSNYGLTIGTFPSGITVTLINNGYISGAGGYGGGGLRDDAGGTPYSAQNGGPALNASTVSGFTFKLNNSAGQIRGGGGGGGYGGNSYGGDDSPGSISDLRSGAGGGGGGQGTAGGAGGNPGSSGGATGNAGTTGNSLGAGSGGSAITNNNGIVAGAGGAGGGWGQSGSNGLHPPTPQFTIYEELWYVLSSGIGSGGLAGSSVYGYNKVDWLNTGTIYGPTVNT
jgi:hypothetical protein